MSLLRYYQGANDAKASDYLPLSIHGEHVGYLAHTNIAPLADLGFAIERGGGCCRWMPVGDCEANTAYLAEVIDRAEAAGLMAGRRNELYAISHDYQSQPHALIERAAMPLFGAFGYGVHVNGLVQQPDGIYMWLGKRAMNKQTSPGKQDQIAAGGQPYGISVKANMQKECAEEAGIPPEISANAIACGMGSCYRQAENGLRADLMFLYDLWLPADFCPTNTDGEVESFQLLPLAHIIEQLRADCGHNIKYNSALVILDCAIRHGIITPDEPDYQVLCHGLHPRRSGLTNF